MDGEAVDVPQFFVCPISLQIMKDPVTATTGITYDRESIERWLFSDGNTTCPLTNQPLLPDLVPNHTLRRLIQAWCALHPSIDRIPTPRAPLEPPSALNLLRDLSLPRLQLPTLSLISALAADSQSNRRCIVNAGAVGHLLRLITKTKPAGEALLVLQSLRASPEELKPYVSDIYEAIETLTRILRDVSPTNTDKLSAALQLLKAMFEAANPSLMERLNLGFFEAVIQILRDRTNSTCPATKKAALQVLLLSCPVGRNRAKMVEAGAVTELIELELQAMADKRMSELVLGVLDHLCTCADGRAQLVEHAAGIAVVSNRILKVSAAADERAVKVLSSVCRYSATAEVLQEMLRVGAVSKLCFVLQADCSSSVREEARWVLRLHSDVWKNSPCIHVYLMTKVSLKHNA